MYTDSFKLKFVEVRLLSEKKREFAEKNKILKFYTTEKIRSKLEKIRTSTFVSTSTVKLDILYI